MPLAAIAVTAANCAELWQIRVESWEVKWQT